jgi:Short C-terminal domain
MPADEEASRESSLPPEDIGRELRRLELERSAAWQRRDAAALRALIEEAQPVFSRAVLLPAQREQAQQLMADLRYSLNNVPAAPAVPVAPSGEAAVSPNAGSVSAPHASVPSEFVAVGRNGQLAVRPRTITIRRRGTLGFLSQGHKGEKEIEISQISAIQFKKNGNLTVGYIQFSFIGGSETKHGIKDAVSDENTILFNRSQEPRFEEAKRLIDLYREQLRHPRADTPPAPIDASLGLADLEKLAELRDKGIITSEEFETKKREILGL